MSGINATVATEASGVIKDHKNSSDKCWLREENTIIKECHLCSNRPECINTSFIETVDCKISGLAFRKYVLYTVIRVITCLILFLSQITLNLKKNIRF